MSFDRRFSSLAQSRRTVWCPGARPLDQDIAHWSLRCAFWRDSYRRARGRDALETGALVSGAAEHGPTTWVRGTGTRRHKSQMSKIAASWAASRGAQDALRARL
eukprot:6753708-Prymnesium_polylepis.2